MAKSPIIVERPLHSIAHEVEEWNRQLRRQAIPAHRRQQDVRNDLEQFVCLDVAARTATAIEEKEGAAQHGAVNEQGEIAAAEQQLDGMQHKELSGSEQHKHVELPRSEAHKQRQLHHCSSHHGDHLQQQQQQHDEEQDEREQQQQQHSDDEQQDDHAQQQQQQGKPLSQADLFAVHAWQKVADYYKVKEQQHGQVVLAKQRSQ